MTLMGKMHLDDIRIRFFGTRRADVIGLSAWEPHVEDLALPISLESGNLSVNKAVIRWMWDKVIY